MLFRSVHSETAVNAALAAYFNANKSDLQQLVAQKKMVDAAQEKASLIAQAVNSANDSQAQLVA